MHSTSHYTMRHRSLRTPEGCVRLPRQSRQEQFRTALREQGLRH